MKIKKLIIFILCVLALFIILNWLISLYSNQAIDSPRTYLSIEEFEKETGITLYNFYDLEEFMTYDRKTPLRTSPNHSTIYMKSNNKDEKNYRIENLKNGFHYYEVFTSQHKESTKDMRKDVLENGILYQRNDFDEAYDSRYFLGTFVKDNFYYSVSFTNNDLKIPEAEQKMIDYIKLVEQFN